jgi:predicted kinase
VTPFDDSSAGSVLVVVSGLPATGKSTVARLLAERTRTPFLRVDRIEQAIVGWSELTHPVGPVGYAVAHALAAEQLTLGLDVIVECVNPLSLTRDAWVGTASRTGAAIVEAELVCSDPGEHRHRVESRPSDVDGLTKPTWAQVHQWEYEPWSRPRLVLDTATMSTAAAADRLAAELPTARAGVRGEHHA